ncbi:MAG: HD domain-containing protein [Opitutales bacterium]|nr:HD domain-containing protein [Opitutales bacterium]
MAGSEQSPLFTVAQLKAGKVPAGKRFAGIYLLQRRELKTTRKGNPFLRLEFADKTGSFGANLFDDSTLYRENQELPEGAIVRVEANAESYNDSFSPRLLALETISEEQAEQQNLLQTLVETCPENPEKLFLELLEAIENISDQGLRHTVEGVINEFGENFKTAPAAIAMHHAYRHGLLEHTVHMIRAGKALLPLYPEVHADLAIAGIIVHDVGKIDEYQGSSVFRKTPLGVMQGHVVLGYRAVRKAGLRNHLDPDLLERLEHIVLSHQGELEWGAAAMAATPEAVFVSMVDNLDAKMGMVQRLLRHRAEGQELSERHLGLKTQVVLPDPPAPSPDSV